MLEITELSAIQKAVLAILSVSTLNSITDDGYNDDVPPVITINGDNPISVELGSLTLIQVLPLWMHFTGQLL